MSHLKYFVAQTRDHALHAIPSPNLVVVVDELEAVTTGRQVQGCVFPRAAVGAHPRDVDAFVHATQKRLQLLVLLVLSWINDAFKKKNAHKNARAIIVKTKKREKQEKEKEER